MTMRSVPLACATSTHLRMLSMKASSEKGFTMPDTPMMLMPPSIPKRGLNVRRAISSPCGTEMVTFHCPLSTVNGSKFLLIISRGPLLMAGSPTG